MSKILEKLILAFLVTLPPCFDMSALAEDAKKDESVCQTYIVFPPMAQDPLTSERLAVYWIENIWSRFPECARLVDFFHSRFHF